MTPLIGLHLHKEVLGLIQRAVRQLILVTPFPTIVPWAEYEAVRMRMESNPATRQTKRQFAFTGLIHCEYCGASATAEIKKPRYIY